MGHVRFQFLAAGVAEVDLTADLGTERVRVVVVVVVAAGAAAAAGAKVRSLRLGGPHFSKATDPEELERIKAKLLIRKLGLPDSPRLMEGIQAAIDTYGRSERNKYRAVVYYMLVKHFGKEAVYG